MVKKNKIKFRKGYSLIEIVAALGLFGVGVLSVLAAFQIGMRSSIRSARYTQAVLILQKVAEEEKLEPFNTTATVVTALYNGIPFSYQVAIYGFDANKSWVHKRINVLWKERGKNEQISTEIFCLY